MTTAYMYDSVNWQAIPGDAAYIAIYRTGDYVAPWDEVQAKYPNARLLGIDVTGVDYEAGTLDVEKGDATPQAVPNWVARRLEAHQNAVVCRVYCSESTWPAVAHEVSNLSPFQRGQIRYWIANWSDGPVIPGGADACQYEHTANWDKSIVNVERFFPA